MSMSSPMNWKSYTLASGAGLLATWFAAAPSSMPERVPPAQPSEASGVSAAASDIEQEASRLQARLQQESFYRAPARNPFRFVDRRATAALAAAAPLDETPPAPVVAAPPPLPVKLAGIASDEEPGGTVRTAILSTPNGVVLARVGDEVMGLFRLSSVDEDGVDLVTIADGVPVRLTLR
jgi:hypothetical protein